MADSRYVVGIDLGTTNSVIAYVDTQDGKTDADAPDVHVLPVPQLVKAGLVQERPQLPSFLYLPQKDEFPPKSTDLPWGRTEKADRIVGTLARSRGSEVPGRVVVSAKSWLGSPSADPREPILPWQAPDDVAKVSPVDAAASYLRHLQAAWDAGMPEKLAKQEVYLAVPASFDASARELTVAAAEAAGLGGARLIEEPQAAFYAWLASTRGTWRDAVRVGDAILVCDVGGGTTDLTLVAVGDENGELVLERKAVGDHILLGGDNMDLTLAHAVGQKIGQKLDEWQFRGLVHGCRDAKEKLLAADAPEKESVVVLGRSRKVVGGSVKTDVLRDDVEATLVDGFFPRVGADAAPATARRIGLQEIGLHYASDPGITRHVAAFVARHREVAPAGPSAVLFNGGVMQAARFRDRMVEVLSSWRGDAGAVRVLTGAHPDLAVAEGAAVYGLARRGLGVRIRGGTARAYYIGVETAAPAVPGMTAPVKGLCVAPFGMEEGTESTLPGAEFGLVVGEAAEFRFFGSSVRRDDAVGTVVEGWEAGEVEELPSLEATLEAEGQEGRQVPVRLTTRVTEVGTLEVWCVARDGARRWKLEFNVRGERGE
jgi:molecular chaperone DnaK (HSP70)